MDKYRKAIELRKDISKEKEQDVSDKLRILLKEHTSKQITTMSIGIIAELEHTFGHLWGHGKPRGKLTSDESEWREEWNLLREFILDRMHKALRKFDGDVDKFDFSPRNYMFVFKGFKNDGR